jgi:type IV secretory pathway TraG/TraD family ATPase VirD4
MQATERFADPFAPLDELVRGLVLSGLRMCVGIALGAIAVRLMRHRHLSWTWALAASVLMLPLHRAFGGWGLTLLCAASWTTIRSRKLHRGDLRTGLDLARIAEARRGPLDELRKLWKRAGPPSVPLHGRLPIGRTDDGDSVSIPFGDESGGGRHGLVVGATGSGKTVTQGRILAQAIERGLGAVVIDPKGDDHLRSVLVEAAQAGGKRLIEWTPRGPSVYNPLAAGPPSAIADKALAGERFTEPHYQRQAQRYLGHAVRALHGTGAPVGLRTLVEQLDPDRLEVLARKLPEQSAQRTHEYLDGLTARQRSDLSGVRDRLAIMAESDIAPWLDPATPDAKQFDLLAAVRERAVVRFSLEADTWPLLAHMLAAAIVQDLQATVSALQGSPVPTLVAIDEFSAIDPEHVARLFGRARSAGVSLLLGTQEISDLRLLGHPRLLEQVLGNLSVLVVHRQVVPESAELLAAIAGNRFAWKGSHSSDGRWTHARTHRPLLDIELIRSLPVGQAAVIEPGGGPPSIAHIDA